MLNQLKGALKAFFVIAVNAAIFLIQLYAFEYLGFITIHWGGK